MVVLEGFVMNAAVDSKRFDVGVKVSQEIRSYSSTLLLIKMKAID
jgi:hypothetical protein